MTLSIQRTGTPSYVQLSNVSSSQLDWGDAIEEG